jgi:hypothetical protein
MIPFLKQLRLTVSSDDHLIEIEGNAESPTEVGNEEIVSEDSHGDTCSMVGWDGILV